jgi:hypothetical protein
VHLQLAGRRHGIDAVGQADERHAETLQFVDQRDEVTANRSGIDVGDSD